MVTKKRSDERGERPAATKRTTTKRTNTEGSDAPAPRRKVGAAVSAASKKATRPKLRASHSNVSEGRATRPTTIARNKAPGPALRSPAVRKAPLAIPRRAQPRKTTPETPSAARQLALDIAAAGLEKKALNCEIIDVRGRIDYADFLVIMTGRSDRHVSSIAQGIEEDLRKKKVAPISIEGMTTSTWVLLDYADVVVHVFQEDARQLYDIEGLWMDASRVVVPGEPEEAASSSSASDDGAAQDEEETGDDGESDVD